MKLLYLSYWGIDEPLTASTVIPHLNVLNGLPNMEKIIVVTPEKHRRDFPFEGLNKVEYVPYVSFQSKFSALTKVVDFVRMPRTVARILQNEGIDKILAKGALAGAMAYLATRKNKVPYVVDSFEPHADYMAESGEWKPTGMKYKFLKKWEQKQMETADRLFTVSENYREHLATVKHVARAKLDTMPCCCSLEDFAFNLDDRQALRAKLGIEKEVTAIYLGKFGGIYYDQPAFGIFKAAFDYFKDNFRLIILTPNPKEEVRTKLAAAGIDLKMVEVGFVPHSEVPHYLSAADFALSTIKPATSKIFCCPVKTGEYWANGLPVLQTAGIGDDARIISEEGGGAVFNLAENNLEDSFSTINTLLNAQNYRADVRKLAVKYRGFDIARKLLTRVFST